MLTLILAILYAYLERNNLDSTGILPLILVAIFFDMIIVAILNT